MNKVYYHFIHIYTHCRFKSRQNLHTKLVCPRFIKIVIGDICVAVQYNLLNKNVGFICVLRYDATDDDDDADDDDNTELQ